MCTLHSFPHNIHHCLTYARSGEPGLACKLCETNDTRFAPTAPAVGSEGGVVPLADQLPPHSCYVVAALFVGLDHGQSSRRPLRLTPSPRPPLPLSPIPPHPLVQSSRASWRRPPRRQTHSWPTLRSTSTVRGGGGGRVSGRGRGGGSRM